MRSVGTVLSVWWHLYTCFMFDARQVSKVLALTRIKDTRYTQIDKVNLLLERGIDETVDIVDGTLLGIHDVLQKAEEDIRSWEQQGIDITTILDEQYPRILASIREAPALIYTLGRLEADDIGVAIVGSRRATERAKMQAETVARICAAENYSVVSGLASGIDSVAHETSLSLGNRTVAIVGTGIDRVYPAENKGLAQRIRGKNGLVLSQFEPGKPPTKQSFPIRNITMSGYSVATIVIAAGEYSGTRQQARRALEHGRNVILLHDVVETTKWGKEFIGKPGVYIAETPDDVKRHLATIRNNLAVLSGA